MERIYKMNNNLSSEFIFAGVSSATMVAEDLAGSFIGALESEVCKDVMTSKQKNLVIEIAEEYNEILERAEACNYHSCGKDITSEKDAEALSRLVESLFNILDSIAPDGTYFGAHPGDGSDFGFWPYEDSDLWE